MNPANEDKIEELKKDSLSNQFNNENSLSLNNSLKLYLQKVQAQFTKMIHLPQVKKVFIIIYTSLYYIQYLYSLWQ